MYRKKKIENPQLTKAKKEQYELLEQRLKQMTTREIGQEFTYGHRGESFFLVRRYHRANKIKDMEKALNKLKRENVGWEKLLEK